MHVQSSSAIGQVILNSYAHECHSYSMPRQEMTVNKVINKLILLVSAPL